MDRARLIGAIYSIVAASMVHAAVPVVESQGSQAVPATTNRSAAPPSVQSGVRSYGAEQAQVVASETRANPPSESVGNAGAVSMFQQFQQLESDVAELRGTVEEQSHLIGKLQSEQKEQYLDLDRRLTMLMKGQPEGTPSSTPGGGGPVTTGPGTSTGNSPTSAGNSEQAAYTAGVNLAKDKRLNEAVDAFNQLLVTYPKGEYAGNTYYWLGECYRALSQLEKSRQSFAQVVNQYPTNPHISDATYKLGVVYDRLGNRAKAMEYLTRTQSQYPGTPAANLARSYAAELH